MSLLSRLLAAGLLALVAATWKLWTPQDVFPQVPLIRAACDWPGWCDWVCLVLLVASGVTSLAVGRRGSLSRVAGAGMAVSLAGFFVLDQHRLQPWAWQFFLLAILLSLADAATARRGWMGLVISIYFWSAVSKFDYTFFHEQGPALVGGLKQALGLRGMPNRWTEMLDVAGSVGLALGEMGVAVMLAWPRTRWLGLWTATIMHLALLAALGPFGLHHSSGVLFWNFFFIAQNWLLFRELRTSRPTSVEVISAQLGGWLRDLVTWPDSRPNRIGLGVIAAAMALPILQPFGYCDHWLAWAVYSARADVTQMIVDGHCDEKWPSSLPNATREWTVGSTVETSSTYKCEFALGGWSLAELKVPIYPQGRFQIGVALAVLQRGNIESCRLSISRTSRRLPVFVLPLDAPTYGKTQLERLANSYVLNAHPRLVTFAISQTAAAP